MQTKGKTILLIIPNFGQGGAQRSFSQVSNHLAKTNKVLNVVFNCDLPLMYSLDAPILSLDVKGGGNVLSKFIAFNSRVRRLKQIKRGHNVDIAISFLEGADYINVLSRVKERIILSVRGSKVADRQIAGLTGFFRRYFLIPHLYRRADMIVTVAKELSIEMSETFDLPSTKLRTIPNSYDAKKINQLAMEPLPAELQFYFDQHQVVIHVGRLHQQKETLWMVEIFHQLKLKYGHARLMLLGSNNPESPLYHSLLNLCTQLHLSAKCIDATTGLQTKDLEQNDILITDHQTNPYPFYRNASIFALTSSWEGFPNVLAEAMVCGCPVIGTACPTGPKEMLAPDDATIFEKNILVPYKTPYGVLMPVKPVGNRKEATLLWAQQIKDTLLSERERSAMSGCAKQHMNLYEPSKILQSWNELTEATFE